MHEEPAAMTESGLFSALQVGPGGPSIHLSRTAIGVMLALLAIYFFAQSFAKNVQLNSYFQAGTKFSFASVDPSTAVVHTMANFTLSKNPIIDAYDNGFGSTCGPDGQMFVGAGYSTGVGKEGAQVLMTISQSSGKIIYQVNLTQLWPTTAKWFKDLKYDPTTGRLWVAVETNEWNSSLPQRFVISELNPQTGQLREVNSFSAKDYTDTALLQDIAYAFNQDTQEWTGVAINNNATISLWRLSIKQASPPSFLPVIYKGAPFIGRLWGAYWTKKYGFLCNSEHLGPNTTIASIDPHTGVITPLVSKIQYLLTNWEPAYDPQTNTLFTYGVGDMWAKILLACDLEKGVCTSQGLHGDDGYNGEYIKGFCMLNG